MTEAQTWNLTIFGFVGGLACGLLIGLLLGWVICERNVLAAARRIDEQSTKRRIAEALEKGAK